MNGQGEIKLILPAYDARQGEENGTKIVIGQIAFGYQEHTPHAGNGGNGADDGGLLKNRYANTRECEQHAVCFFECGAFSPKLADFIYVFHV